MKTYIMITKYSCGDSLRKQINGIIEAGKLNKDTRLFFSKDNCITMRDLASIMAYFDLCKDMDFDSDNLVLIPRDNILSYAKNGKTLIL